MARWNRTLTLLTPAKRYQDEEGGWHYGEPQKRVIFCNEYTIGIMAMSHLRSSEVRMANDNEPVDIGIRNEHMVQVRSVDYNSEDRCIYENDEYEILYSTGAGDYRLLTIGQRIGNERKDAEE